jgi:hypothetical protein
LDSTGSGQGPVAGYGECGDEPSGSCATELVIIHQEALSYKIIKMNQAVKVVVDIVHLICGGKQSSKTQRIDCIFGTNGCRL